MVNEPSVMEVDQRRGTRKAFPFYVMAAALLLAHAAVGQRIDRMYTSHTDATGTLYFIYADPHFKGGTGRMAFDITRHTQWQDAVMRLTIETKELVQPDSVQLICGTQQITLPLTRLYAQRRKNHWVGRYETRFGVDALRDWIGCAADDPPVVRIAPSADALDFSPKHGYWRRAAPKYRLVMDLVDMNR